MAAVLNNMGTRRAFVVHGYDGLDEISIEGPTIIAEVHGGTVTSYTIAPEQFGIPRAPRSAIAGGSPSNNAVIIRGVLDGQKNACRDIVVLNAAFALVAAGVANNPEDGIRLANDSIDSGSALKKLEALVKATRSQ
jgi:anthranilate phosphoribosyltransferase